MNLWLSVFRDGELGAEPSRGDGHLRHRFAAALGDRYRFARPEPEAIEGRAFEKKAELLMKVVKLAGGCGG